MWIYQLYSNFRVLRSLGHCEIRCSGHCRPLPSPIHQSGRLDHPCCAAPLPVDEGLFSYSWPGWNPDYPVSRDGLAGWWVGVPWSWPLWRSVWLHSFLTSKLSDACLWRVAFLFWEVRCGKKPNVLVFLTGFSISLQDLWNFNTHSPPHTCGFSHFFFLVVGEYVRWQR